MNYNFLGVKMKFKANMIVVFLTIILFVSIFGNVSLFTPAYAACTLQAGTGGGGLDSDCDGISDTWELNTTVFPGANRYHKNIYVEIDYLTGHRPDSINVITPFVNAFSSIPNSLVNNPDGFPGVTGTCVGK